MKLLVCAIYDSAVKAFNVPLTFRSRGEAIRSFQDACSKEDSNFFLHSADYSLMELGEFDDATGALSTVTAPSVIMLAADAVRDPVVRLEKQERGPRAL